MSTATAVKPSLTIKRRFNAPPEKVFAAWADAEKMKRWMGPAGTQRIEAACDLRVGGRYDIKMMMTEAAHDVGGVYREIVPNEKLVFTWAWKTMPERESLVTVTFKRDRAGTIMTLLHEQFADDAARDRHNAGWLGTMERLEKYLAQYPRELVMAHEWTHGSFYWNELMTRDAERDKKFYAGSIGWSFDAMPMADGTYWVAKMGNESVGGLFPIGGAQFDGVPESWMSYLAVDDVDARVKKAQSAGAKLMRPIFDIPGVGRIAILREPGGAGIGWITPVNT